MLNQLENCDYNPNLILIKKIQTGVLFVNAWTENISHRTMKKNIYIYKYIYMTDIYIICIYFDLYAVSYSLAVIITLKKPSYDKIIYIQILYSLVIIIHINKRCKLLQANTTSEYI